MGSQPRSQALLRFQDGHFESGVDPGNEVDGLQHGVSIQMSINLGKKVSPQILLKKKCCNLNLGVRLCTFPLFLFPDY